MRRWTIRICVLLVLGAIVNVAVAWGCAIAMPPALPNQQNYMANGPTGTMETAPYRVTMVHRSGVLRARVLPASLDGNAPVDSNVSFSEVLPRWAFSYLDLPELEGREVRPLEEAHAYMTIVDARGWPCLSTWGAVRVPARNLKPKFAEHGIVLEETRHGVVPIAKFSGPMDQLRFLTFAPIWPGFAINTVFYAALLIVGWLFFFAPFAVRRWWRIKRGLCVKCAYPIGVNNVCTECGAMISRVDAKVS